MLALIAGRGRLPAIVASAQDTKPFVASIRGGEVDGLTPQADFTLENIAGFLSDLKQRGITEVCFAGAVKRPGFHPDKVEPESRPYAERIIAASQKGDNGALVALLGFFEEAGFTIRGAHEIAPFLLPPFGGDTKVSATRDEDIDLARAVRCIEALGAVDMGQSCVVNFGQIIAAEAQPGTDWMLESLAGGEAKGGLFYKAPKPGQDRRVDLPTIGPGTVKRAAKAGLRGIMVEADGVMVLDYEQVVAEADKAGMFFCVQKF